MKVSLILWLFFIMIVNKYQCLSFSCFYVLFIVVIFSVLLMFKNMVCNIEFMYIQCLNGCSV